jgi:hypothetical protein
MKRKNKLTNRSTIETQNGFALFFVMMLFGIVIVGLPSLVSIGANAARRSNVSLESKQAFYLAESAVELGKILLRDNYESLAVPSAIAAQDLGAGQYSVTINGSPDTDGFKRQIIGFGAVPNFASPVTNRSVEVIVKKPPVLPSAMWNNAIYSAGEVTANGNAYEVNGDVVAADGISYSSDHISGSETIDAGVNPLPILDFEAFIAIAMTQVYDGHDNYFTAQEIANGELLLPISFYFEAPSAGNPFGVPNIVYIEGNVTVTGNWGNIGGFLIVVGDIDAGDTTINGNGEIDGVVYTLGEFRANGGGAGINVNGGVLSGSDAIMNGNTNITYNQSYMDSIENMNPPPGMTVLSWRELVSAL